ncbi:MAG: T9SS type A sorting domain-containing protein, partial [Flavisolibacter sp.]
DFAAIVLISARNTSGKNIYSYVDADVSNNRVIYYRLRMVNTDGSYTYSTVLPFRINETTSKAQVAPNPVRAYFTLTLQGMQESTYRIELVSTSGQVSLTRQVHLEGSYAEKIERGNVPSGLYVVRVTNIKTGEAISLPIVLQ